MKKQELIQMIKEVLEEGPDYKEYAKSKNAQMLKKIANDLGEILNDTEDQEVSELILKAKGLVSHAIKKI